MKQLKRVGIAVAALALTFAANGTARSATVDDVVGTWEMVINMGGREQKTMVVITKDGDGIAGELQSPQGAINADELALDGDTLTWSITLEQLGGQKIST